MKKILSILALLAAAVAIIGGHVPTMYAAPLLLTALLLAAVAFNPLAE